MSLMPGSATHTKIDIDDVSVHSSASHEPTPRAAEVRNILETTTTIPPELARELEKCVRIGGVSDQSPSRLVRLTPREVETLKLLARGHSNKSIARELGIVDSTVKVHIKSILRKLDVRSRVAAALIAFENGLVTK
jgi:two-component system nitrate/nitrite response regulator NarL